VDFFCERYLLSLIRWCQEKYHPQQSGLPGNMLHFGVRHPEIFGTLSYDYTTSFDHQWSTAWGTLGRRLGPRDVAVTVDGQPAWEQFNLGWYLRQYPERDIPFLVCLSSTGKDNGHTSEFGWQDDPRGWAALRDARQNFLAFWSWGVARNFDTCRTIRDMRWDKSVPAFSHCSLDDNPGSGDPADGDPFGQINGYLLWEYETVVEEPDRWEMTVHLTGDCPSESCVVDITPRRLSRFQPEPGQTFRWSNTSLADGRVVQSGTATADQGKLLMLKQVVVTKSGNRVTITR
jgi:hypothetical protein